MDINLTMKDLKDLRIYLRKEIRYANNYIENHQLDEHGTTDGKVTYYDYQKNKIITLEPILNKINEQFENANVKLIISNEGKKIYSSRKTLSSEDEKEFNRIFNED